jgi:rhamnose transport system permease protein
MVTGVKQKSKASFRWEYMLFCILVIVMVVDSIVAPEFLNAANILKLFQQYVEEAIIGVVVVLLLISGNIDISIAGIVALSATVFGVLFRAHTAIYLCVVAALATGTFCGWLNGVIVVKAQIPSIIVTLATMSLYRGFAYILLQDQGVYGFPNSVLYVGNGNVPGTVIPIEIPIFLFSIGICWIILHKLVVGKKIYAVGLNPRTCYLSGIDVKRIHLSLFATSGFVYACSAILLVTRIGSVRPNIATGFELDTISTAVFGGIAIFGGSGTVGGYVISALTLGFIRAGLNLKNVSGQFTAIISGVVLIASILVNNIWTSTAEKRAILKRALELRRT